MNKDETCGNSDPKLTQGGSPSVRGAECWIVRDKDDNPWGPFESAKQATVWAEKKWPGGADDTWDVIGVQTPDEL